MVGQHHDNDRPHGHCRHGARREPSAAGQFRTTLCRACAAAGPSNSKYADFRATARQNRRPGRSRRRNSGRRKAGRHRRSSATASQHTSARGTFSESFDSHEPHANSVRARVQAVLTAPRPVIVADRYRPADPRVGAGDGRVENGMWIEAALSDGHWLLFLSNLDPPPAVDPVATEFSRASFATWLVLSILLAILLSMLAARRLIKPLVRTCKSGGATRRQW